MITPIYHEYCYLCQEVVQAPSRDTWIERKAFVEGFASALSRVGFDVHMMGLRAQRMWVEQDKARDGIPVSHDDPPTIRTDDWQSAPHPPGGWGDGDLWGDGDIWGDGEAKDTNTPKEDAPTISVQLEVAQHDYEDDWDWYEGTPGVCGAPFCGKPGDHPIHLKPHPHEYEEHPEATGLCRECGHTKDQDWHTEPSPSES